MDEQLVVLINTLAIGGVSIAPIIYGLVELAKRQGMPKQYAPLVCGVLALCGYILISYLPQIPNATEIATVVATVTISWMTATGIYKMQKGSPHAKIPPDPEHTHSAIKERM